MHKSRSSFWTRIALALLVSTAAASGCTLITEVDRSKIDDNNGGAAGSPATGGSAGSETGGSAGSETGGQGGAATGGAATGGSDVGGMGGA